MRLTGWQRFVALCVLTALLATFAIAATMPMINGSTGTAPCIALAAILAAIMLALVVR